MQNTRRVACGPHVAGIDLGSREHWVCVPSRARIRPITQAFGTTTPELQRIASKERTRCVQWIQQALEQMNVQVHREVSNPLDRWRPDAGAVLRLAPEVLAVRAGQLRPEPAGRNAGADLDGALLPVRVE